MQFPPQTQSFGKLAKTNFILAFVEQKLIRKSLYLSMSCTNFRLSHMGLHPRPQSCNPQSKPIMQQVRCGLRNERKRKPLWRKSFLSTEAIQSVQRLKLAKNSSDKLEQVFSSGLVRLLKADLLDTLSELQRQNELQLALKVFEFVRKEVWYEADLSLYCNMILLLGKNKMIESVEQLFIELKREGLEPDARVYAEIIGAYFNVDMVEKAMEIYELMMSSGCVPDNLVLTILIRNLGKRGEEELVARIKKECAHHLDSSDKFFKQVEKRPFKRRTPALF